MIIEELKITFIKASRLGRDKWGKIFRLLQI
jgi:hypothetical protein